VRWLVSRVSVASLTRRSRPHSADWEGFLTGTRAAAAGGVTTVVDMPLNSFPTTTTKETFLLKLAAAKVGPRWGGAAPSQCDSPSLRSTQGKLYVDVAFWGGLVPTNANNASQLTVCVAQLHAASHPLPDAGVL
jgi:allantoinase